MSRFLPSILLFLSGFSGLVYQVLWMRQLGLLFGNTSHATAVTLAAFFGGLAAGSWFWGRRSKSARNPLRTYAWLEAGIALTALLYFVVLHLFYSIYPEVYQRVASESSLLLAVKFLLALILVFPPAFMMGGTIPMIGQAVIPKTNELGIKAASLYACNTVGAAAGAFAAAFFLVPSIGYTWTCITAVSVTVLVATLAGLHSKTQTSHPETTIAVHTTRSPLSVSLLCFLSGFVFLTLEVLWTRLLAQIHINSVYSFSTVLVIVLLALALGAAAASGLARLKANPRTLLSGLLLLGGLSIALSPFIFMAATEGFQLLDTNGAMADYLLALFGTGAITIGLPAFLLGIIFPFLMKSEEPFARQAGTSIGRLSAINTFGAIAGSLLCGFVFLTHLGLWRTLQLSAALYLITGLFLPNSWSKPALILRGACVTVLVLLFTLLSPIGLRSTAGTLRKRRNISWRSGRQVTVLSPLLRMRTMVAPSR
jgi:spermidine synthase